MALVRIYAQLTRQLELFLQLSSSLSVSSFDQRAGLTITAICNPQNIDRVQECPQEELDRLWHDGVTQEELEQAREGWLQAQKVTRSSDSALAGMLSNLRHPDRTLMWDDELENQIGALTPEQVLSALRKHVDPQKLVIVTARDFETKTAATVP